MPPGCLPCGWAIRTGSRSANGSSRSARPSVSTAPSPRASSAPKAAAFRRRTSFPSFRPTSRSTRGIPAGPCSTCAAKSWESTRKSTAAPAALWGFPSRFRSTSNELPRIVGNTKPGIKAPLELWRKGATREITVTVGELPEDRVATRSERRGKPPEQAANRLGFAVVDLTAEQKRDLKLGGGVIVEEVRNNRRADVRAGDVITAVTSKGQTTEVKSTEQFNKLLGQLERNTTLTLHVRRGESNLFVTVRGEGAPG